MISRTTPGVVGLLIFGWALTAPAADVPKPEHPTPDAVRPHWANLNGPWQFRFDAQDEGTRAGWSKADAPGFDRTIVVPFGWESELSGIHQPKGAPKVGWYRREFAVPDDFPKGDRVWLRFGAVDYRADVWVNGTHVAEHEGGYAPFEADVTDALKAEGANVVVVRAFDPTDPNLPTGKQVGWYTPTSGIWQTVWLESRPKTFIRDFTMIPAIDPASATFTVTLDGLETGPYTLSVRSDDATVDSASMEFKFRRLGVTTFNGDKGTVVYNTRSLQAVKVPVRDPKLWTPETPHLYDVTLELKGPDGKVDSVKTYFGLRTIARGKYGDEPFERILLNGKPIFLRGALDQSFNPKGIYTAPDDAFLKHDIELAKSFNLNCLRIHIKPDEPRRLYWADKLGMLILEDMPNTWRQNATARQAWEHTMREVVARDRNHPAIIAWIDFNETWGLGHPSSQFKTDVDTQRWVQAMVAETRKLDPTRLVEDDSPCNFDHVEGTDLNSWHFYIDDHDDAAKHIALVVARTEPGSPFNYCPGMTQGTAPLINSEYGNVSAGSGDRDISWGFRDLTTLQRKQPKIQGYIYTELDDIEWEHNGFVNYDRTPKEFGYDAFVPGMTVADLQGADFIGYDGPPAQVVGPGQEVTVPLFVSHYSDLKEPPTLRWGVSKTNDPKTDYAGPHDPIKLETWTAFGVTQLKPIHFKAPKAPFVGAVWMVLDGPDGKRIAANFTNLVVQDVRPEPRVERLGDHEVAIRFAPDDFARERWSEPALGEVGKAYGEGKGFFEYHLKLPEAVVKAGPDSITLTLEAAAKAGREKVDWPSRVNAQDYPQTDARKWPSTLEITINGQKGPRVSLADDPADARGVLSHLARIDHGSHGERVTITSAISDSDRSDLAAGKPLAIRLAVPDDADQAGGLCVFGADAGARGSDPTLLIRTKDPLPADLGVKPDRSLAIDSAEARQIVVLPAGDSPKGKAPAWAYTTTVPGIGWSGPDFDDSTWNRGEPGFGSLGTPALKVGTPWTTRAIWLRTTTEVPELKPSDILMLHIFHDEDVAVFVNGKALYQAKGHVTAYQDVPLDDAQKALFHPGVNAIAVESRQTRGGQGIDLGLRLLRAD